MLYQTTIRKMSAWGNVPFSPHNGLFLAPSLKEEDKQGLIRAIAECLTKTRKRIWYFNLPPGYASLNIREAGVDIGIRRTFRLALHFTEEELFQNCHSKTRNIIRQQEKVGHHVLHNSDRAEVFMQIRDHLMEREVSINDDLLQKVVMTFDQPSQSFTTEIMQDRRLVASTLCIHDGATAYYLFGARGGEGHQSSGTIALWQSILHAKHLGCVVFDFEGSMIEPVARFFKRFGGEEVLYPRVFKAGMLAKLLLRLSKFKIV